MHCSIISSFIKFVQESVVKQAFFPALEHYLEQVSQNFVLYGSKCQILFIA